MNEEKEKLFLMTAIVTILALVIMLVVMMALPIARSSKAIKYDLNCTETLEQCKTKN